MDGDAPSSKLVGWSDSDNMTTGHNKHMDVRCHFCRETVESGDIEVQYCATENMLPDVLTKPLVSARHNKLCNSIMGLHA
jgi:hypothetical protein